MLTVLRETQFSEFITVMLNQIEEKEQYCVFLTTQLVDHTRWMTVKYKQQEQSIHSESIRNTCN